MPDTGEKPYVVLGTAELVGGGGGAGAARLTGGGGCEATDLTLSTTFTLAPSYIPLDATVS